MSSRDRTNIKIGKRTLSVVNLDKVLYPKTGFTKGQVIDYYRQIAPTLLPHLKGHPITLKRYPNGVDDEFFYEKRCPAHRPDWMQTTCIAGKTKEICYCMIEEPAALVWTANLASLELHPLLYTARDIECPTVVAFDLDPGPPADILDCIRVALDMRDMLKSLKLKCFPKVSGGKGLHLYVPLNTKTTFDATKDFARAAATALESEQPPRVVSNMKKSLRKGKVFVDWSQNDSHKTTVAVYSIRARAQPTVSAPVTWRELKSALDRKSPGRLIFLPDDVLKRVSKHGDIFHDVLTLKQRLPNNLRGHEVSEGP